MRVLALALALCAAAASEGAAAPHLVIHRQHTCAYTTLWDARFADIAALEHDPFWTQFDRTNCSEREQNATITSDREPCWQKQHVQVVDDKLALGAANGAAKVRAEKRIESEWRGVNVVQAHVQFPQVCVYVSQ